MTCSQTTEFRTMCVEEKEGGEDCILTDFSLVVYFSYILVSVLGTALHDIDDQLPTKA